MYLFPEFPKKCIECGEVKSISEFHVAKRCKDGRAVYCKECIKKRSKEYYAKTTEKKKAYAKEYYVKNAEKRRAYSKEYHDTHVENHRKYCKEYYKKNAADLRKRGRAYRAKNLDKIRKQEREWGAKNREKIIAKNQRRRARELSATGIFDDTDIKILLSAQKNKCLLCSNKFTEDNPYTVDHIVPLSKGGRNDILNLQLLHKSCNSKKRVAVQDLRSKRVKLKIFKQGQLL